MTFSELEYGKNIGSNISSWLDSNWLRFFVVVVVVHIGLKPNT